ncbi:MAG: histone deacetylase [Candidatus Aminicenantales bacterium]
MKTGIVKDWSYREHDMGAFHVETPQRIEVLYRMIEEDLPYSFEEIKPRPASEEELERIHTRSYIESLKATEGKERVILDPDTSTSARSYEVALLAAGGVLEALDEIIAGRIDNAFALVRPPGHHAESARAMGFCLFNNTAIGAAHLLHTHGCQKVLIVDWDLHHGNGTQNAFYQRNDVLYFSTHQYPHYPGSGHWRETGAGPGAGFTINVPLRAGKTDSDYLRIFQSLLRPVALSYRPDFWLVSAGFDAHEADPLGGMRLTGMGFAALTAELLALAKETAGGRILFVLEGGYDLEGLRTGVREVLGQLTGEASPPSLAPEPSEATLEELRPVVEALKSHWPSISP